MKIPSKTTLRKYGLSQEQYEELYYSQLGVCPICGRDFDDKVKPVIDHFHLKSYHKKSPEIRRKYIRGLLCTYDNFRVLNKNINLKKAKRIVTYLENFEEKLKIDGLK